MLYLYYWDMVSRIFVGKKVLYTYDADIFLVDVQCGPPKRDVNVGLDSPLQNTIVICVP